VVPQGELSNFFENSDEDENKRLKALVKEVFCVLLVPRNDWSRVSEARDKLCYELTQTTARVILKHTKDDDEEGEEEEEKEDPMDLNGDGDVPVGGSGGAGSLGVRKVGQRRADSLKTPMITNGIQTSPKHKKSKKGFSILHNEGRGNCFYESMAQLAFHFGLRDADYSHEQMREEVCEELQRDKNHYESFVSVGLPSEDAPNDDRMECYENWDDFMKESKKNEKYAHNVHLIAASRVFNRPLRLKTRNSKTDELDDYTPPGYFEFADEGGEADDGAKVQPFTLLYTRLADDDFQHYQAIVYDSDATDSTQEEQVDGESAQKGVEGVTAKEEGEKEKDVRVAGQPKQRVPLSAQEKADFKKFGIDESEVVMTSVDADAENNENNNTTRSDELSEEEATQELKQIYKVDNLSLDDDDDDDDDGDDEYNFDYEDKDKGEESVAKRQSLFGIAKATFAKARAKSKAKKAAKAEKTKAKKTRATSDAMETSDDEYEEEREEDVEEQEEGDLEEPQDVDEMEDSAIKIGQSLQAANVKKTKYEKLDLSRTKIEFACTSGSLSWRTYAVDLMTWMLATNERAEFVLVKYQEVLRPKQIEHLKRLKGDKAKMEFIVKALEKNKDEVLKAMRKEENAVRVLGQRKQQFLTKHAELLGGLTHDECLTISENVSLSKENHEMLGFEFGSDQFGDISSALMDCGDFSILTAEGGDETTAMFKVRTNEIVQRENEAERAKLCALEDTFRFYSLQGQHVGLSTLRALKEEEWTILKVRPKAFENIKFIGPRDCKKFSAAKISAAKAIRGEFLTDEAYMRSARGFYVCINRARNRVKWIIIFISACRMTYLEAWLYYDYTVYLATENIIRTLRGQLTFAFDHNGLMDRRRERTTGKALVRKEMRPYGPFPDASTATKK
jgi:hypothetical protein